MGRFVTVFAPSWKIRPRTPEVDGPFDNLVLWALRQIYGGQHASGVRFGSPPSGDRPGSLKDAVEWLAGKMRLDVGTLWTTLRPSGDKGVDVVVWRHFMDENPGFPLILCQCTVSAKWHKGKVDDINGDVWRDLVSFGRTPLTALAVPWVVDPRREDWDEIVRRVHIPLDRLRIIELVSQGEVPLDVVTPLLEWVASELVLNAEPDRDN